MTARVLRTAALAMAASLAYEAPAEAQEGGAPPVTAPPPTSGTVLPPPPSDAPPALPRAPAPPSRGFGFVSPDGAGSLYVRWLVQTDYVSFVGDKPPGVASRDTFGIGFAGLQLDAALASIFHSSFLVDFSQSRLTLLDAFIDARFDPAFVVRVGKFPTPLSEERLTPKILLPWISTGPASMLLPVRELGVQIFGEVATGVVSYNAALVNGSWGGTISDNDADSSKDGMGRVFVRPFKTSRVPAVEKVGVGLGASWGDRRGTPAVAETPVLRTYGNATFFAYASDGTPAGTVVARGNVARVVPHATYAWGPFAGFFDYAHEVDHVGGATVTSDAWGATASVALTGEDAEPFARIRVARPWNPSRGHFGGVQLVAGGGVVHVASSAFDARLTAPGAMQQATILGAGLNWYLVDGVGLLTDVSRTSFTAPTGVPTRPREDTLYARLEFHL